MISAAVHASFGEGSDHLDQPVGRLGSDDGDDPAFENPVEGLVSTHRDVLRGSIKVGYGSFVVEVEPRANSPQEIRSDC